MNLNLNICFDRARVILAAGGLVALVAAMGCDARYPLRVKDPDVASPGSETGLAALPLLRNGTLADFAVALAGAADQSNNGHEGIANMGAIFTDEMTDYDTFPTRNALNTRLVTPDNSSVRDVYEDIDAVNGDALRAIAQYKTYDSTAAGLAEMYNLDGYVYILIAEHWCSGQPFSVLDLATGNVTNGAFLTTTQMFDTARARFALARQVANSDTVSAEASDAAAQIGFATVGTARALLDEGSVAAAADTAALVTSGFSYQLFESANSQRQENGVWQYSDFFQAFSVGDRKNGTGLPFHSANDPRVPDTIGLNGATDTLGSNNQGPFYNELKYPAPTSNMTVADYTEAQLIVAEGHVFAGNYSAGKAIMDNLRSTVSLGPLPDSSGASPKGQMLQVLSERAFWMWVTGHRLGDWRRVLRAPYNTAPFSFVAADVYPMGSGIQPTLEFPTPSLTKYNPNYQACDATVP